MTPDERSVVETGFYNRRGIPNILGALGIVLAVFLFRCCCGILQML